MLEDIQLTRFEGSTYRLVNQAQHVEYLRSAGLDPDQVEEMLQLLRERGITDDPTALLDGPFSDKPFLRPAVQTRFSDGTVRVFYSALETETVERETEYWYLKPILEGLSAPTRMYYRMIRCRFAGPVKDLRPKISDWPFLVADNGYAECNEVGKEAVRTGLAGLLSESARNPGGTTLPVFLRPALDGIELRDYRVLAYDPSSGVVAVSMA